MRLIRSRAFCFVAELYAVEAAFPTLLEPLLGSGVTPEEQTLDVGIDYV